MASLLLVAAAFSIAPSQALAYSYGDANTEDVAETFKLVSSELAKSSPGWKAAEEAYKVRRSEIESHFGKSVAATLDHNFKDKDAKLVVANFKAVLVMNLDRRFSYTIKGIDDYAGSKLLLAKAKATYDTLEPYYKGSDKEQLSKAFDEALEALGNPGLFGAGKKEADLETLKAKTKLIYNAVKPSFPYTAYVAPVNPPASPKPSVPPSPKPSAEPEPSAEPSNDAASASPTASPSASPAASPSETASASPSASAEPSATASASVTTESGASPSEEDLAAPEQHAKMEQSDKTNGTVTFAVIGGVIVAAGAGIWLARRKKWF